MSSNIRLLHIFVNFCLVYRTYYKSGQIMLSTRLHSEMYIFTMVRGFIMYTRNTVYESMREKIRIMI